MYFTGSMSLAIVVGKLLMVAPSGEGKMGGSDLKSMDWWKRGKTMSLYVYTCIDGHSQIDGEVISTYPYLSIYLGMTIYYIDIYACMYNYWMVGKL